MSYLNIAISRLSRSTLLNNRYAAKRNTPTLECSAHASAPLAISVALNVQVPSSGVAGGQRYTDQTKYQLADFDDGV